MENKRNWKIIYSNYKGAEKKAVELIYKEMGDIILRDKGVYTLHTLPCESINEAVLDKNAVVIGKYAENEIIRKYISEDEISEDGYVVKVMDNPENTEFKLVLITGKNSLGVFYGAVDFVDDYFVKATPNRSSLKFPDEIFDKKIPDYYNASAPKIKTRSIFTWGHPINDYRNYIENMARLKLNQLIIWNDYVPINASDIIEYAHEFDIQVIWGYAWGWSRNCAGIDIEKLDELTENIINKYETEYANIGVDGIYFQSFTEMGEDAIPGVNIAEIVTNFVNKTSNCLLEKYPNMLIQFGLHATSVKTKLEYIDKVDKRISIIWEDCGSFPYDYMPFVQTEDEYKKTLDFTDEITNLRNGINFGVLYKGQMVLDWDGDRFVHQSGPFVLGVTSKKMIEHDLQMLSPIWRNYQTEWLKNGKYAYDMTNNILKNAKGNITIGIAGQLAGEIWFSEALCSQMLWECDRPYEEILDKVLKRRCVKFV